MKLEDLSPEDRALLDTEFPAEVEKLASANIASLDCAESLREFGAAKAEVFLVSAMENGDTTEALEKQAAAAQGIEDSMKAIRALNFDHESQYDEAQFGEMLEKEAAAAAQAIAEGYFGEMAEALDQNTELVKEAMKMGEMAGKVGKYISGAASAAAKGTKDAGKYVGGKAKDAGKYVGGKAKDAGKYTGEKVKAGYKASGDHVKKHPGKYGLGAGALMAAGGMKGYDSYKK